MGGGRRGGYTHLLWGHEVFLPELGLRPGSPLGLTGVDSLSPIPSALFGLPQDRMGKPPGLKPQPKATPYVLLFPGTTLTPSSAPTPSQAELHWLLL